MLPEKIIFLTIFISLPSFLYLVRKIKTGQVRLNLVSWILWTIAPFFVVFFALKAGGTWSVLPVFFSGFFPLLLVLYSIAQKNTYWKIGFFDILCGIFSCIALLIWILTHNTSVSAFFAILSDGLAAIPTIKKSWLFPETESSLGYLPGVLNNILGLLVIKNWVFSVYGFSVYIILLNTTLILFILRKKIFKSANLRSQKELV